MANAIRYTQGDHVRKVSLNEVCHEVDVTSSGLFMRQLVVGLTLLQQGIGFTDTSPRKSRSTRPTAGLTGWTYRKDFSSAEETETFE